MLYVSLTYYMIVILVIQVYYSKFVNSETEIEVQTDMSFDDFGLEDNVGIHESYRPKHKYKFTNSGTAKNQDFSKRSLEVNSEVQEDNLMQCGVMFKNSEPVGILQPYEDSYRFLPVNGEPTFVELNPVAVKKKSIMDIINPSAVNNEMSEDKADNKVGYFDDNYPAILAKFKLDTRMATNRRLLKRATESTNNFDNQLNSLKSTMVKVKSEDNDQVEEELKNILDDMGLIDDYSDKQEKREVAENENEDAEDENLEMGTNKINMLKENKQDLRSKRESHNKVTRKECSSEKEVTEKTNLVNRNEDNFQGTETACPTKTVVEEDDDEDARKKRANLFNDSQNSDNDFVTDSSKENEEINSYEKRVEREIRDKIQKLKEEVKKEIYDLSNSKKMKLTEDSRRKKRQIVPTLLDEETKEIDPTLNDNENRVHIRKKRDIDLYNEDITGNKETLMNSPMKRTPGLLASNGYNTNKIRQKRHIENLFLNEDAGETEGTKYTEGNEQNMIKENGEPVAVQYVDQINPNIVDQSSFIFKPKLLERKSCTMCKNSNCHCDKNGNCKCGSGHIVNENNEESSNFYRGSSDMDFNLPVVEESGANYKYYDMPEAEIKEASQSKVREPRNMKQSFHFTDGEYFIDEHPEVYKLTPVGNSRFQSILSTNEAEDPPTHLLAIKQSLVPHSRFRRRIQTENNMPLQLIDMSAEDLFGALPQSYEGELSRYKRVKRANIRKR